MIRPALLTTLALLVAGPAAASEGLDKLGIGKEAQAAVEKMQAGDVAGGRRDLEALVKAGRTDAAEVLGELLRGGAFGMKADPRTACRHFVVAARDRGDGRHNLAFCFETGDGGRKDLAEAVRLYGEAGEMGYATSWCAKGNLLIAGKGAPRDVAQGVALCQKGAEGGSAHAQTDLANFYLEGRLVPRDAAKAAFWYGKAAAQGQANAAFLLGQMHWNGDGVPKDHPRAAELWRIAYEGGRPDAPFLLGREALNRSRADPSGLGDAKALEEAIGWMDLAARSDPDPKIRKMAADGLPILRANLELVRKMKP